MFWNMILPFSIYGLNAISIFSLIFFRKKDMSVTFAWLLVMIFLPLAGFVLYFFFGSTRKLELMSKKYYMKDIERDYDQILKADIDAIRGDKVEFNDPETEKYRDMIIMNARNSGCLYTQDNCVELLVNGPAKFACMMEEIDRAEETINVLYFIIKTRDQIGKDFVRLLAKKASQGVEVKLVYDGMGCLKTFRKDFKPIEDAGGKVQRFLPSHLRTILLINYRLHRKMVIIDGKAAYTGGINVGDDYLGLYPDITPWRDTSIRVTGQAVRELQLRFLEDWVFLEKQNKKLADPLYLQDLETIRAKAFPPIEEKAGTAGVQIISCGPDCKYQAHKDSYVKILSSAKDYVYIQSPYFVPDQTLLETMRLAARSGVDVRLMIPGIPDKRYVYYVAQSYVEELLEAGIRVFCHKGFIHAKTFVSDNHVASVGTTNLDLRSFKLDYEINTLVYDRSFALTCREQYLKDIEDSAELNLAEWRERGPWRYICESVCRFIAPLA